MTIGKKLAQMLMENGMSEQQANEVLQGGKETINETLKEYNISLQTNASDYPTIIIDVVYGAAVKPIALKWIDANKPLAWFRPMFV